MHDAFISHPSHRHYLQRPTSSHSEFQEGTSLVRSPFESLGRMSVIMASTFQNRQQKQQRLRKLPRPTIRRKSFMTNTPSTLRCFSLLVCLAVLRTIYKSVLLTTNTNTGLSFSTTPFHRSPSSNSTKSSFVRKGRRWFLLEESSSFTSIRKMQQQRRSRTRPPPPPKGEVEEAITISASTPLSWLLPVRELPGTVNTTISNDTNHHHQISQISCPSSKSRVLITGIFSHAVFTELAVVLQQECHLAIWGISYQNQGHLQRPEKASFLMQSRSSIQLHTRTYPPLEEDWYEHMEDFRPTHILQWEERLEDQELYHFQRRQRFQTVERIGKALIRWQESEHSSDKTSKPVQWLYVTMPSASADNNNGDIASAVNTMLLQTFRTQYSLDVRQVSLPLLYGAFDETVLSANSVLKALDDPSHPSAVSLNGGSHSSIIMPTSAPMAHLDDAVQALVQSMSHSIASSRDDLPIWQLPTSSLSTATEMLQFLSSAHSNNKDNEANKIWKDRSKLMMSWFHQRQYPLESTSSVYGKNATLKSTVRKAIAMTQRRLQLSKIKGISMLQRQQNDLLPCASQCAIHAPCRNKSVWDPVIPLSLNLTQDCRFVVYTTAFSDQLIELPNLEDRAPVNIAFPTHLLCQLAFVSSKSPVVPTHAQNGQSQQNGWTLLWPEEEEEDDEMEEVDRVFPKIAPRAFFAHNVTKAMYLESRLHTKYPPKPAIWYLLSKQMDAKRQPFKSVRKRNKVVDFPAEPPKHIALFAHTYDISNSILQSTPMVEVAQYILYKQDYRLLNAQENYREDVAAAQEAVLTHAQRQLEFYDFSKTIYEDWYEIPNSFLLMHNLESPHAQQLRCDWYEEHSIWKSPRLEDLALAYVLARRRARQQLIGPREETWGERMLLDGQSMEFPYNTTEGNLYYVKLHSLNSRQ